MRRINRKGEGSILTIILIAIIIIGAIYFFMNWDGEETGKTILEDVEDAVDSFSEKKNCQEKQVPYDSKEEYQGFEDVDVNLKYETMSASSRESYSELFNVRYKGMVNLKNVDDETGHFNVKMTFETLDDGIFKDSIGGYIQPGESKEFEIYYDIDAGEDVDWSYVITPGTKTITKPVTKHRIVTKYRPETVCD